MTAPSPERARLVAALRDLRARTGLSMAGLGAKTAYSKSSWERYLNGKTLPPRQAVQDLCRLAGEPEGRCLALWEIAESRWSGRAAEEPRAGAGTTQVAAGTSTPTRPASPSASASAAASASASASAAASAPSAPQQAPPPRSASASASLSPEAAPGGHRSAVVVAVLASVCALAVGGVAVALFLLPDPDGGRPPSAPSAATASGPGCRGVACEGRDPTLMRCAAGPDTVASHRTTTGAWMELRYSKECGAGWARMWGTKIGDRLELIPGGRTGRVLSAKVEDDLDAEAYVYTPMTATRPGTVVRACFRPAAGGARECFEGRVR